MKLIIKTLKFVKLNIGLLSFRPFDSRSYEFRSFDPFEIAQLYYFNDRTVHCI